MVRVELAVYDLSRGMAANMSQGILGQRIDGIWHTGIVFLTEEYYFGGGVQVSPYGVFARNSGMNPTHLMDMGETSKSKADLQAYLRTIANRFTMHTYDLIRNNCNNFANELCMFLTGHGIPSHIIDLPNTIFSTPFGAMLRPMIENMQQSVHAQSSTMDPFGQSTTSISSSISTTHVAAPSSSQQSSAIAPETTSSASAITKPAVLHEQPLVSGDTSAAAALGGKLLKLTAAGDSSAAAGSGLSDQEKAHITAIITLLSLSSATAGSTNVVHFTHDMFHTLEQVMNRFPSAQMSCLFLLRLMVLREGLAYSQLPTIDSVIRKLVTSREPGAPGGFTSSPALVMALCVLANLATHQSGLASIFNIDNTNNTSAAANAGDNCMSCDQVAPDTSSVEAVTEAVTGAAHAVPDKAAAVVDISMCGLSHERAEVRQMSAALAYNLTLACTREGRLTGAWSRPAAALSDSTSINDDEDLHPHALHLLCGCLEGIDNESDELTRKRRLAAACRIVRAYGTTAVNLSCDLGFDAAVNSLLENIAMAQDKQDEIAILRELSNKFASP